jgi:hypothetical protein
MNLQLLASLMFLLQQAPFPQAQQQQNTPKGSIEGVVLRLGTGEPISGARVTLARTAVGAGGVLGVALPLPAPAPPVLPGASVGAINNVPVQAVPAATTDAQGRFVINGLDAAPYRLTVAANAYARQEYGQRSFGAPGSPINVAAGQAVKDIVIRLTPAGYVTGRVSDDAGMPAIGVNVQLLRATFSPQGQRTFQSAGQTRTNDRGEYRLFWVTPGRYYLNANMTGLARPVEIGGAGDSPNGVSENYAAMYYPGVADIKDASIIEVQPAAELGAIDFAVPRQQLHRIRGRVIDSSTGQRPTGATLSLSSRSMTGGGFTSSGMAGYNSADGTFELRNVAPGTYIVSAQIPDPNQPNANPFGAVGRPTGTQPVTVGTSDVDGVVLNIVAPAPISGRLFVDGQDLSAVTGIRSVRIQLNSLENLGIGPGNQSPQFQAVNDDGTFRLNNVMPGQYRVTAVALPAGFYLKDARFDQNDVLSKPLQFSGPVSSTLDVLVSPKAGQLDGTVTNGRQEPAAGIQAVLIPAQRDRTELYKTSTTDQSGHFSIRGIPPGEYKIFAWENLEQFAYFDSDLMQRFEAHGKPLRINEADKQTIEVQVIP